LIARFKLYLDIFIEPGFDEHTNIFTAYLEVSLIQKTYL